jgi:predicted nucleotidyltransferase
MRSEEVLAEVRPRLERTFGARLKGVILYGSRARGTADETSDLDLLVVLAEPVHLGVDLETIVRALYPLQLRVEGSVHALPVSDAAFELAEYALYREAKQDGIFL